MSTNEMQRIECQHEGDLHIGLSVPVGGAGKVKPQVLRLANGENKVPADLWALAREQGVVKRYLDAGVLEDKGAVAVDYTEIPQADAIEMARGTMSEPKIDEWLVRETRPAVRSALEEQRERFRAVRTGSSVDDKGGRPVGGPEQPSPPPSKPTKLTK